MPYNIIYCNDGRKMVMVMMMKVQTNVLVQLGRAGWASDAVLTQR